MPKIRRIHRGWIQVGDDQLINLGRMDNIRIRHNEDSCEVWGWANGLCLVEKFDTEPEARAFFDEIVGCLK